MNTVNCKNEDMLTHEIELMIKNVKFKKVLGLFRKYIKI